MIFIILSDENYEVESFQNIEEFNRIDQSFFTDLFLLYVMLQEGNGIDVCASLESRSSYSVYTSIDDERKLQ